ncbi:Cleavage/polyadenylation specificity factor, A subunit, partial [Blyttiomyces helicus]
WNVKEGKRYISVGTEDRRYGDAHGGRVIVFNLKEKERDPRRVPAASPRNPSVHYKMKQLGERVLPSAVFAICPFMGSYLVVATGQKLVQLKIDSLTRKLVPGIEKSLRWPIHTLSACGSHIAVGGPKESLSFYTYMADSHSKQFAFVKSDRFSRFAVNCVAVDERTAIATDGDNVFGLVNDPGEMSFMDQFRNFASFFGEKVSRLQPGSMMHRFRSMTAIEAPFGGAEVGGRAGAAGRENDVLYGCSMLGSVFALQQVPVEMEERLEILQKLMGERDGVGLILGNTHDEYRYPDRDESIWRGCVDGDFVSQYLLLPASEAAQVAARWNELWRAARPLVAESEPASSAADLADWLIRLNERC